MFATHYHELTGLEGSLPGIKNYRISVKERGDDIIFLRKIVRGGADQSFGIQVARLAGLPIPVIERAKAILSQLEEADIAKKSSRNITAREPVSQQLSFFQPRPSEIEEELKNIDILNITPIEAMNILNRLVEKAKQS